jgi:metal-sulfur cluster biosynthetic enzyme
VPGPPSRARVIEALGTVRDPELDEPVTTLGFVTSCDVSADGAVHVHLRLPTYFCAPNFAFLMVADAYDAVASLPGVRHTDVVLEDHFAADTINDGVAARTGFVAAFGSQAAGELDTLRRDFVRKAVLAGTDRVCRPLLAAGLSPAHLATMTLGEVPPSADLDRVRARRTELGLAVADSAPLIVDVVTGHAIGEHDASTHLGRARLTQVNIEANAGICRGLLQHRYGIAQHEHKEAT